MRNNKFLSKIFNKKNLVLITVPILLLFLFKIYNDVYKTTNYLASSLIKRTIKRTKVELDFYLSPVVNNALVCRERGYNGVYSNISLEDFNKQFIPIINNSPLISSIIYTNSNGKEIMLLKEDSTWQNRVVINRLDTNYAKRYRWKYDYNNKRELIKEWILPEDKNNTPLEKDWLKEAISNKKKHIPAWTNPYKFATTKEPGITASIKWYTNDTVLNVLAFDVLLKQISDFTTNIEIAKHGELLITSIDGKTVGLPNNDKFKKNEDILSHTLVRVDSLNMPVIISAKQEWKKLHKPNIFKFKYEGERWWCGIDKYLINQEKIFYIIILVPESDFLLEFNNTKKFIFISFFIAIFLIIIVIRAFHLQQKLNNDLKNKTNRIVEQRDEIIQQRDVLHNQKLRIESIHKELTQSIDYSSNIQGSMMPDFKVFEEISKNFFVFYRPKDKISGDFYWWKLKNNKLIVTAADCTGHGVPGALLSMIGISTLESIVERLILEPAEILNFLRKYFIKYLNQKGDIGKHRDGIDMSLVNIDLTTGELVFAGANNPIYIIRDSSLVKEVDNEKIKIYSNNNSYLLYEFKPDKMPVSFCDNFKNFSEIKFEVRKGDIIYLFSDGFIDQFGGETKDGKKFLSKNFKDLLLSIVDKSLKDQEIIIKNRFLEWKGNLEQTDDVLIIGIKI